jgi:phosphatidylglycerophosphate synthase
MPQAAPSTLAGNTLTGEIVGTSSLTVWSLPSTERLARLLRRAGATAGSTAERCILLRADWVYDEVLVKALARRAADCVLVGAGGECVAINIAAPRGAEARERLALGEAPQDLPRLDAATLAGNYNDALRKREPPFLLPLTRENQPEIESLVFKGSYKGVTDFVTLYFWPRPAQVFTGWCARLGISPNMVTSLSLVCVLVAMWCFWHGHFGWGLASAWFMTFLDTVDGKLARVTLRSSPWGNVYDHSIDLIHPPFWWWAWMVGLGAVGMALDQHSLVLWVIVGGYVLQRVEEGIFGLCFKMDMHVWQRFDSLLRLVTARRNPNLAIVTVATVFGRPDTGIVIVAWWVAICLVLHAIRLLQAAVARRHGPLRSWLN